MSTVSERCGLASPVKLPPARITVGHVPEWDMSDLIVRPCPVCESRSATPLCERPDKLTVVTCDECKMVFVREVPSDAQLNSFYQAYATFKGYARSHDQMRRRTWLESVFECSQNLYIEALEQTGGIAGRSLIDFGCSTGRFLELFQFKGGTASGVEIDADARREAQRLGLDVRDSAPDDVTFDVVSALQVLEHLRNPLALVQTMARLCRPEGRIVVAVPNATELAFFGVDWIGFRVDLEHFNYFSVESLGALLRRGGLWIEHAWQHRQPALARTDLVQPPLSNALRDRAVRFAEMLARIMNPPPERFLQGSFTLSLIARPG